MIRLMYTENSIELPQQTTAFLYALLAEKERLRIERLYRWQDRQASLLGKFLLYKILGDNTKDKAILSHLTYSTYGKPLLDGAGVFFNISHSGNYVVCAVSEQQDIGLDIEKIEPVHLDDFTGTLSQEEISRIANSPQKDLEFFNIWTTKEAILKARGSGIVSDMAGFKRIGEGIFEFRQESFFVNPVYIDPQYCCALAGNRMQEPVQKIKLVYKENRFESLFL